MKKSKKLFTVMRVSPGIYLCEFQSKRDLALSFLRMQEYYESPKFTGKIFTLSEFKTWYRTQKGRFSYGSDWSGFNIPGHILKPFMEKKFSRPSELEKSLLDGIRKEVSKYQDPTDYESYYVIGVFGGGGDGTIEHEMAHAFFYTDNAYRKRVLEIVASIPSKRSLIKYLKKKGYGKSTVIDEIHAYLAVDLVDLKEDGINVKPFAAASRELQKLLSRRLRKVS